MASLPKTACCRQTPWLKECGVEVGRIAQSWCNLALGFMLRVQGEGWVSGVRFKTYYHDFIIVLMVTTWIVQL